MVAEKDVQNLITQWSNRIQDTHYETSYKDAISECIYDLSFLIMSEEEQYEYFKSLEAESAMAYEYPIYE